MYVHDFNLDSLVEAWIAAADIVEVVVKFDGLGGKDKDFESPQTYCGYFYDPGTAAAAVLGLNIEGRFSVSLGADFGDDDREAMSFRGFGGFNSGDPLSKALKTVFTGTASNDTSTPGNAPESPENGQESEVWKQYVFDFTKQAEAPVPLISRDGVPVSTRRSITMIVGDVKGGKSCNAALMIAAAVSGADCFGYVAPAPLRVLVLDSEMNEDEAASRLRGAFKVAGLPADRMPHNLTVLRVRGCDYIQRRAVLKSAAYSIKPDVIFIDGAADFVPDPNDSGMSKALTDDFCSISDNCDCSIIAVVHSSKDDRGKLKAGGHLGGYLGRKDSCAMLVYRSGPVITVQFTHGRSSGFSPFSFSILQDGSFQLVTVEKSAHKEKAGPSAVLTKILEVLQPGKEFKTSDIVSALEDFGFSRTNVQNNIKTAVETGQIQQIRRGVYAANSQPESA